MAFRVHWIVAGALALSCVSRGGGAGDDEGSGGDDDGATSHTSTSGGTGENCGDGDIQTPEDCDGDALGGASCSALGLGDGELGCTETCAFDTSQCSGAATTTTNGGGSSDDKGGADEANPSDCGNGEIGDDEQCDGDLLGGATCTALGFPGGGTLLCDAVTCTFDLSQCEGGGGGTDGNSECGNGEIETGETCEPGDLQGLTCQSFGFTSGTLGCDDVTCTLDTSMCAGGGGGTSG